LQNFKTLVVLEISLLLSGDIEWGSSPASGEEPSAVLSQSGGDANADTSEADDDAARGRSGAAADPPTPPPPPPPPSPPRLRGGCGNLRRGDTSPRRAASAAAPASAAAAPAAPAAADEGGAAAPAEEGSANGGDIENLSPDTVGVNDFTTWSPDTWHLLPFDKISFPSDPNVSICTFQSYMALAMILYYETGLRNSQQRLWDELSFAWRATFHSELHPNVLER
jgi:hypothetical protein